MLETIKWEFFHDNKYLDGNMILNTNIIKYKNNLMKEVEDRQEIFRHEMTDIFLNLESPEDIQAYRAKEREVFKLEQKREEINNLDTRAIMAKAKQGNEEWKFVPFFSDLTTTLWKHHQEEYITMLNDILPYSQMLGKLEDKKTRLQKENLTLFKQGYKLNGSRYETFKEVEESIEEAKQQMILLLEKHVPEKSGRYGGWREQFKEFCYKKMNLKK